MVFFLLMLGIVAVVAVGCVLFWLPGWLTRRFCLNASRWKDFPLYGVTAALAASVFLYCFTKNTRCGFIASCISVFFFVDFCRVLYLDRKYSVQCRVQYLVGYSKGSFLAVSLVVLCLIGVVVKTDLAWASLPKMEEIQTIYYGYTPLEQADSITVSSIYPDRVLPVLAEEPNTAMKSQLCLYSDYGSYFRILAVCGKLNRPFFAQRLPLQGADPSHKRLYVVFRLKDGSVVRRQYDTGRYLTELE